MKKDAYSGLISLFREEGSTYNSPDFRLGKVAKLSPLIVETGDLQLFASDILVNADAKIAQGDLVALQPLPDGQTFVLLCKVVKA